MHSIFNDATLPIKKTNDKANSKKSIKIMNIYINEVPEKIRKPTILQNNINYDAWWLVHVSMKAGIPKTDTDDLIKFIIAQFDTFKPDEKEHYFEKRIKLPISSSILEMWAW